jgi:hypothetical protein
VGNADHLAALIAEINRDEVGVRYYNPVGP